MVMKPYDIVRPTGMGFLDIVWEVEEVTVKRIGEKITTK